MYQISAMNRLFATHKYSWNFEYEWVNSIEIQLLWFIPTHYNIEVAMNMSTTLTSHSYHSKYIWFIRLLIHIHRFRKIFIILINDRVIFSCCRIYKRRNKKNTKTVSKANTQPYGEYCSVPTRIILILWFL